MKMKKYFFLILAATLFAACGGDGDGDNVDVGKGSGKNPEPVAPSANGFTDYSSLIGMSHLDMVTLLDDPDKESYSSGKNTYYYENLDDESDGDTSCSLKIVMSQKIIEVSQLVTNPKCKIEDVLSYFRSRYYDYGSVGKIYMFGNSSSGENASLMIHVSGEDGYISVHYYLWKEESEPAESSKMYTIFDKSTGVVTIKYGEVPQGSSDNTLISTSMPSEYKEMVKKVIFDPSVADARPIHTANWFSGCKSLTEIVGLDYLNTSKAESMLGMFSNCSSLTSLDLRSFDTSSVEDMSHMFSKCISLTSLDLSSFNIRNVNKMYGMFDSCSSLTLLDLSNFGLSRLSEMTFMFHDCTNLVSLDLSNLQSDNICSTNYMFDGCSSLTDLKLDHFKIKGSDAECMFYGCSSLTVVSLPMFDTSNVTSFKDMFNRCSNLEVADLSNFDTSNVENMRSMFYECRKLRTIYASDKWIINKIEWSNKKYTFWECNQLVGGMGTQCEFGKESADYARIDGGPEAPGYFTAK